MSFKIHNMLFLQASFVLANRIYERPIQKTDYVFFKVLLVKHYQRAFYTLNKQYVLHRTADTKFKPSYLTYSSHTALLSV